MCLMDRRGNRRSRTFPFPVSRPAGDDGLSAIAEPMIMKLWHLLPVMAAMSMSAAGATAQGWVDPRTALREQGIDLRFRVSGFGAVAGAASAGSGPRFGGQGTVWLDLDLARSAGFAGTSVHVRFDQNVG
jgi:carbohydrate-selective porin OprB